MIYHKNQYVFGKTPSEEYTRKANFARRQDFGAALLSEFAKQELLMSQHRMPPTTETPLQKWLRTGREKLQLSCQAASLQAGLAITSFSLYERGKGIPSPESFVKVEKLLGSAPQEVLDWLEAFRTTRKKEKADLTPPEHPTPMQSWLFNCRKETGLPCQTLSLKLGLGPTTFTSYEKGIYVPKANALKRLTAAFGPLPPEVSLWLETYEKDAKQVPLTRFEPPKNPTPFQAWIFGEREKRQRTRQSMSKECGLGACVWGQYEEGKYLPSGEALEKLERVLGPLPPEVKPKKKPKVELHPSDERTSFG